MQNTFHMLVKELFALQDGRTILAGPIEEGERAILSAGPGTIWVEGEMAATITIEPEMIASRAIPLSRLEMRSVSTKSPTGLTKEIVGAKECRLEGPMRVQGHRHLVGIDSPPADFVADDMTLGPRLPEGWDGDAWMSPNGGGYFLRAWSKKEARYATALGGKYEEAREKLLNEIAAGGSRVEIRVKPVTQ